MSGLVSAVGNIENSASVVGVLLGSGVIGDGDRSDSGEGLLELVLIATSDLLVGGDLNALTLAAFSARLDSTSIGILVLVDGSAVPLEVVEHIVHPSAAASSTSAVYEVLFSKIGESLSVALVTVGGLESTQLRQW